MQRQYDKLLQKNKIKLDQNQAQLVSTLQEFQNHARNSLKNKLFFQSKFPYKGIYIYGDVGSGKSMIMDLFYQTLSVKKKKRMHFHEFMSMLHHMLHEYRKEHATRDVITKAAKNLSKTINVLCLDELQVTDIADAMILGRLFIELLKVGILIVITSNRPPDDLYKDGLQRENFLPFIQFIKDVMLVTCLNTGIDYRLGRIKSTENLYNIMPIGKGHEFISKMFFSFTDKLEQTILVVNNRNVIFEKTYKDILWSSFADLCGKPLGPADYLAIAKKFSIILMEDIPKITNRNEAIRFITLIDNLYENKVKLICTAEAAPDQLYNSFEFARTVSRLMEMQSIQKEL